MQNISWEAAEFKQHSKTQIWYIIFAIVSLLLIGYAIYQKSLITTIAFILLSAVSLAFALKKPTKLTHHITSTGIVVGDIIYPYKTIKSFWIVYDPPQVKTLNFETTAYLNRFITVQLEAQDPVAVKVALKKYLVEDLDREESFSEALARKLKF